MILLELECLIDKNKRMILNFYEIKTKYVYNIYLRK